MKQFIEYILGLLYKLFMMWITWIFPAFIFGENQSVLTNTTVPDSTLKKKPQSIAYQLFRKGDACD